MWKVFMNGKWCGIAVSNYAYEVKYWAERQRLTGHKFELRPYWDD